MVLGEEESVLFREVSLFQGCPKFIEGFRSRVELRVDQLHAADVNLTARIYLLVDLTIFHVLSSRARVRVSLSAARVETGIWFLGGGRREGRREMEREGRSEC